MSFLHKLQTVLFRSAEQLELPRKTVLQQANAPIEWIYGFTKGVGIAYAEVDTGDVYTRTALFLFTDGDLILPIMPVAELATSPVQVELANNAQLLRIPFTEYLELRNQHREILRWEQHYRMDMEVGRMHATATLKTMRTVTERMLWLLTRWPECFHELTDQVMGDFLGGFTREIVCKNRPKVIEIHRNEQKNGKV